MTARGDRDLFLRARHALKRHLEAQIPAGDHHGVGRVEDVVELVERLGPLQFRDKRDVTVRVVGELTCLTHVGRAQDEADRDHVHAEREAERSDRPRPSS